MNFGLKTNSGRKLHSAIPELANQFLRGEVNRRDFLRTAAWLGVSLASAKAFTGALAPTPAKVGAGDAAMALRSAPHFGHQGGKRPSAGGVISWAHCWQ